MRPTATAFEKANTIEDPKLRRIAIEAIRLREHLHENSGATSLRGQAENELVRAVDQLEID